LIARLHFSIPAVRINRLETNMHDFPDKELGKAIPYGVYDIGRNEGWVNVGISHDTSQFAANSIRRWWTRMGRYRFPKSLYDLVTVVNRISHTTTSKGLLIKSAVDTKVYEKGIEVTDSELASVKLKPHNFHGEWNYTVKK